MKFDDCHSPCQCNNWNRRICLFCPNHRCIQQTSWHSHILCCRLHRDPIGTHHPCKNKPCSFPVCVSFFPVPKLNDECICNTVGLVRAKVKAQQSRHNKILARTVSRVTSVDWAMEAVALTFACVFNKHLWDTEMQIALSAQFWVFAGQQFIQWMTAIVNCSHIKCTFKTMPNKCQNTKHTPTTFDSTWHGGETYTLASRTTPNWV